MTLLTSLITRDFVVAVADRRITMPDGTLVDDERNKVVQYGPAFAFTYTGLAQLEGSPTDEWLAKTLASIEPSVDLLEKLSRCAEFSLSRAQVSNALKRQAFLAIGWGYPDDEQELGPMAVTISNSVGNDGRWGPVTDHFRVSASTVPAGKYWSLPRPLGAPVSESEYQQLAKVIRRARKHNLSPVGFAHILARFSRSVADRCATVSRDLVAVVLPRPNVESPEVVLSSPLPGHPPDLAQPVCFLMRETERRFRWTLPSFVHNGVAFTETQFLPTDDGWTLFARVLGRPRSGIAGLSVAAGEEIVSIEMGPTGPPFQTVRRVAKPVA